MSSRLNPQKSLCCLISQLNHSMAQEITASLDEGFTVLQVQVLAELANSPGLSAADLARFTCVTPQNMSLAVSRLVKRGCVVRASHSTNARIRPLGLTARGRQMLDRAIAQARRVEERTFSVLLPRERKRFLDALQRSLAQLKTRPPLAEIPRSSKRHRKLAIRYGTHRRSARGIN